MKKNLFLAFLAFSSMAIAQSVGIGTKAPERTLDVGPHNSEFKTVDNNGNFQSFTNGYTANDTIANLRLQKATNVTGNAAYNKALVRDKATGNVDVRDIAELEKYEFIANSVGAANDNLNYHLTKNQTSPKVINDCAVVYFERRAAMFDMSLLFEVTPQCGNLKADYSGTFTGNHNRGAQTIPSGSGDVSSTKALNLNWPYYDTGSIELTIILSNRQVYRVKAVASGEGETNQDYISIKRIF